MVEAHEEDVVFWKQKKVVRLFLGLAGYVLMCAIFFQWQDAIKLDQRNIGAVEKVQMQAGDRTAMITEVVKQTLLAEKEELRRKGNEKDAEIVRLQKELAKARLAPVIQNVDDRKSVTKKEKAPAEQQDRPKVDHKISPNITVDSPIFVLSLPNSGSLTVNRLFKCAGLDSDNLGRYWTQKEHLQIGQCMDNNLRSSKKPILSGCGDYRVWTEMDFDTKMSPRGSYKCFFPSLQPAVLTQLFQAYPNAKVVNVINEPNEWYTTLSPGIKKRWPQTCNTNHDGIFPQANATKAAWIGFYKNHHKNLRQEVAKHPSVSYIEIDLTAKPRQVANMLRETLGTPQQCWSKVAANPSLPKDITFPIFVASLPKSATSTSHGYLACGLGNYEGSHQWTRYQDSGDRVTTGECFRENVRHNRPITDNCGDLKHWSDFGTLQPAEKCYYPTLQGGLEAFYKSHPYATILQTTRDAKNWYKSALKWSNILGRWTRDCEVFPKASPTNETAWTDFYHWHTEHVREFAKNHPTMNYVEVQVEKQEETHQTLQQNFGFESSCWGHSNVNKKKQSRRLR